jgi:hypothetical protein
MHHAAVLSKVKLSAEMPTACCSGVSRQPCDLSTPAASPDQLTFQAIPSTPGVSSAILAGVCVAKPDAGRMATPEPPPSTELFATQPIYLAIQSILI